MKFIFNRYSFDPDSGIAKFNYHFDSGLSFEESVVFQIRDHSYDSSVLDQALFLSFILVGTSYWKTFPTTDITLPQDLDNFQAKFFNSVFQEGMSQYAFENNLTRDDLAHFIVTTESNTSNTQYKGRGVMALQSGGKDSLLTASLLEKANINYTPWYVSSSDRHPSILDHLSQPPIVARRNIDHQSLSQAVQSGALNGHVPVTFILQSFALIQAILLGKNQILTSIGHEGSEPHLVIDDLAVNHQWSKTWEAEQLFSRYVQDYISADIQIGSPLRQFSELKIAELFVQNSWTEFGHSFSSCNVANYRQGTDNSQLTWCGNCPKCANSFLLFAPFLPALELKSVFGGRDLFANSDLAETFQGLLGLGGIMKPFECVGETSELRRAYHMIDFSSGYSHLPFDVPSSSYDHHQIYPSQSWAHNLLFSFQPNGDSV